MKRLLLIPATLATVALAGCDIIHYSPADKKSKAQQEEKEDAQIYKPTPREREILRSHPM
jgi:hypothetical protein